MNNASSEYLDLLLQYYEEEVSGAVYFKELSTYRDNSDEIEKFNLLAEIESCTAKVTEPLIKKYNLKPASTKALHEIGLQQASDDRHYDWNGFVIHMNDHYPSYIDDFLNLKNLAPTEDKSIIQVMTDHEIVAVEFARRELNNEPNSLDPLLGYIKMHQ